MLIKVRVFPGSSENKIEQTGPGSYYVWVRAQAEHNHANILTTHLLTEHLKKGLKLVSGATKQNKVFRVFELR